MELRQLRYFVGIVDAGSVSRASQALHIAQPALSQQISRLEDELGVQLLARSVRGVTPTAAGTAVYGQAQQILKQIEATPLIARQADIGPAGPVAVGLPWTITSLLGLSLLEQVRSRFASVRLEIVEGPSSMLALMLAQGKLDLAIVFDNTTDGGLQLQPLVDEALMLVGPPGAAPGGTVTLDQIAALPLLLLSRPNGIREALERAWHDIGAKPGVIAEINSSHLLVRAVEAGLGWSVLPSCGIETAVRSGRLSASEIDQGRLRRTVYLGTSRLFAPSGAAVAVLELVQGLVRDAVKTGAWRARIIDEGCALDPP